MKEFNISLIKEQGWKEINNSGTLFRFGDEYTGRYIMDLYPNDRIEIRDMVERSIWSTNFYCGKCSSELEFRIIMNLLSIK